MVLPFNELLPEQAGLQIASERYPLTACKHNKAAHIRIQGIRATACQGNYSYLLKAYHE